MDKIIHFQTTKSLEKILEKNEDLFFEDIGKQRKGNLNIEIFPDIKKHKIIGMGYSFEHSSCYNVLKLNENDQNKVLKLLIDPEEGANMNFWRLCIGTPDFTGTKWYSYCDNAPSKGMDPLKHVEKTFSIEKDINLILHVVRKALTLYPNIKFFASPWSPPSWMKDTNSMCGGKLLKK